MRPLSLLAVPALSLSVALACGGEFETGDHSSGNGEEDAGTGGASASSGGASASSGGRSGSGGRPPAGGTPSTGGSVACCEAVATCAPGYTEIPLGMPCPDGWTCSETTTCCTTILCGSPGGGCDAYPSCDPGDQTLTGACPPDRVCYARSLCGSTVHCIPAEPAVDGGASLDGGASCDPKAEPDRKYVSLSPDECTLIDYTCVTGTTHFFNACGCGCEQPSWCPDFANCMPGGVPFVPPPGGDPDPCSDPTICPFTGRAY